MEQKFKQRLETNCDMSDLPNSITPTFNYRAKCRHGESYDHDDNHLVLIASKTIIYCEEQESMKRDSYIVISVITKLALTMR